MADKAPLFVFFPYLFFTFLTTWLSRDKGVVGVVFPFLPVLMKGDLLFSAFSCLPDFFFFSCLVVYYGSVFLNFITHQVFFLFSHLHLIFAYIPTWLSGNESLIFHDFICSSVFLRFQPVKFTSFFFLLLLCQIFYFVVHS